MQSSEVLREERVPELVGDGGDCAIFYEQSRMECLFEEVERGLFVVLFVQRCELTQLKRASKRGSLSQKYPARLTQLSEAVLKDIENSSRKCGMNVNLYFGPLCGFTCPFVQFQMACQFFGKQGIAHCLSLDTLHRSLWQQSHQRADLLLGERPNEQGSYGLFATQVREERVQAM